MIEYTIHATRAGRVIVRNPAGNECAQVNSRTEAEDWVQERRAQEAADSAERARNEEEQGRFSASVPDLNRMQIRWQTWRCWFYDNLMHENRRLSQHRRALDMVPDGAPGQAGTAGSPSYTKNERYLTADQQEQESARALYAEAIDLDTQIKAARRDQDRDALAQALDASATIIERMRGFFAPIAHPD